MDKDQIEQLVKDAYYAGYRHGLWQFAWMKDGVSYVGSGIINE